MAHAVVAVLMLALACAHAQTYTLDTQQPQKVCPEAGLPSITCGVVSHFLLLLRTPEYAPLLTLAHISHWQVTRP